MDVREKLVELLNEVQETGVNEIPAGFGCTREYVKNENVAAHLIAHGVTVQEWISVTERMPEKNDRWVLCLCVSGAMEVLEFDYTMRNWDAQYPRRCYMENYVTHWMPLPKPPKGE